MQIVYLFGVICLFLSSWGGVSGLLTEGDSVENWWQNTPMPSESLFRGYDAPIDKERWHIAAHRAAKGTQVLLKKVAAKFDGFHDGVERDFFYEQEYNAWIKALIDVEISYAAFRTVKSMLHRRYHSHGISPMHSFDRFDRGNKRGKHMPMKAVAAIPAVNRSVEHGSGAHISSHDWLAGTFGHILHGDISHIRGLVEHGARGRGQKFPIIMMGSTVIPLLEHNKNVEGVRELVESYNRSKAASVQSWFSSVREVRFEPFHAYRLADLYTKEGAKRESVFPQKVVLMGSLNENWGWLSTYVTNRTAPWQYRLREFVHPVTSEWPQEEIAPILDDPNVEAIIVNGHMNLSHPKIISLPLGLFSQNRGLLAHNKRILSGIKDGGHSKDTTLFYSASNFGVRPALVKCISDRLAHHAQAEGYTLDRLLKTSAKGDLSVYYDYLTGSRMVLCLPGVGYDTYRLYETLLAGAVPVVERGFGMERTLARLPVLFVDDFATLTPTLLRQAYVQALYIADGPSPETSFDFSSLSATYWQNLIKRVKQEGLTAISESHPYVERDFIRPLIPFEGSGVVEAGAKRPYKRPRETCAVRTDPSSYHDEIFNGIDYMKVAP